MFDFEDELPPAYDVYGVPAWTLEEACIIAGVDTPAQVRAEIMAENAAYAVESLRLPVAEAYDFYACPAGEGLDRPAFADEIPF